MKDSDRLFASDLSVNKYCEESDQIAPQKFMRFGNNPWFPMCSRGSFTTSFRMKLIVNLVSKKGRTLSCVFAVFVEFHCM